jgi:hypothetical protein
MKITEHTTTRDILNHTANEIVQLTLDEDPGLIRYLQICNWLLRPIQVNYVKRQVQEGLATC